MRQAMVIHNRYPWERSQTTLRQVASLGSNDFVIVLHPRNDDVREFIRRVRGGRGARPQPPAPMASAQPSEPFAPVNVREQFQILPHIEALAVYRGEVE